MANAIIFFAGMVAVAWLFWLVDWIARWRDRRSERGHV
jgi:uncharacterized metal-binding protein